MFGNILSAIARPPLKENSLQQQILEQIQGLEEQLQDLEHELTKVPLESIASAMQQIGEQKGISIEGGSTPHQTIAIIDRFYRMCAHQHKQNKRCHLAMSEVQKIIELFNRHDLTTMLNLNDALPSQINLQYINKLLNNLENDLLYWQNQRNINLFQAEEGEEIQHWDSVIKFLERAKCAAESTYDAMIKRSYSFSECLCILKRKYLSCLWSERGKFWQDFLVELMEWLEGFIVYDINNRQYTVKVYDEGSDEDKLWLKQVSKIIFESSEIGLHEEALRGSLSYLNAFLVKIEQLLPPQRRQSVALSKRKLISRFKDYFQHMIPYLKMERRKVFMELLAVKGREDNLYDLLLNLKAGRQDADILIATIQALQVWMQQNPQDRSIVMLFLDLANQSRWHWSTVMFVSDQLLQAVEDWEEGEEKMRFIRQLLMVREDTRIKLHGGE